MLIPMTEYNSPDPIAIACNSCGCQYTLFQTWHEPPVSQELACEECGHIIWRSLGGRRYNSYTGQNYAISGEYQGRIKKLAPRIDDRADCDHEYQKERTMGAHTGDWKCVKCGDVRGSR